MALVHVSAPIGMRTKELLSADNSVPERHIVIELLRNAAPVLGLNASVIATLDAMLSCLPPRRTHHTVFASNATLTFRRNGISDRTLRRHAAILQDAGILLRRDSPNRKRFTRHNPTEHVTLRFGFDLSPLFTRLQEIASLAAEALRNQEQISYLRCKIRAISQEILRRDPLNTTANLAIKLLRRKLSYADYEEILAQLHTVHNAEYFAETSDAEVTEMTGSDSQNVRHHHSSKKEITDKEDNASAHDQHTPVLTETVSLQELVAACPEATQFMLRKVECFGDVVDHARTLAPMMGIDANNYKAAQIRLGSVRTAITVWALMQLYSRIQKVGAYFRAITTGTKSSQFVPEQLIRRLAREQGFYTS